ncbi:MAG TPA: preprotein translocase subunit SecY [Actinomycetota bacterium]|nr:preprotein translocase subunit SecY [Actinomycetota bacterium]
MLAGFASIFRTPDLRNKVLITLGLLALYRMGCFIPIPGVSYRSVQTCIDVVEGNSLYGLINLFSGGALLQLSVFALGVVPYITASIIIQLLTVVIPRLEALKKEGQSGQAKMTQYTRYLTVGLAVLQCTGIVALARSPGRLFQGCPEQLVPNQSIAVVLSMILTMTAGTVLVMWFGEIITDKGIGNGMSLLIFASILSAFPGQFATIFQTKGAFILGLVLLVALITICAVVYVEQAQRRVPVQYAKRMVGNKLYGGASTYIPLKVNMAGVIPVIFASSLLYIPQLIVTLSGSQSGWAQWIQTNFTTGDKPIYLLTYFLLIVFFAYFYVAITFNPVEVADDMKKYGGFIPGIRAGKPTAEYLNYVLTRLTFPGSLYLGVIAIIPFAGFAMLGVGQNFLFGGTSLLIMVGVGLDPVKQLQSQLQQRNYEGFLR